MVLKQEEQTNFGASLGAEQALGSSMVSMGASMGPPPSLGWAPPTPATPEGLTIWDSPEDDTRERASTFGQQLEEETYGGAGAEISSDEGSDDGSPVVAAAAELEVAMPALAPLRKKEADAPRTQNPKAFAIQVIDSSRAEDEQDAAPPKSVPLKKTLQQQWGATDDAMLESSFSQRLQQQSDQFQQPSGASAQSQADKEAQAQAFANKLQKQSGFALDAGSSSEPYGNSSSEPFGGSSEMESSFAQRLQAGSRAFVEEKQAVASLDDEIIQDVLRAQHEEEHSSDESDGVEPRTEPSVSPSPDQQGSAVQLAVDQDTKRLCCGWMDQLFRALYADVRCFAQWMIEDEQVDSKTCMSCISYMLSNSRLG